jgi:hypothetical protein
MQELAREAPSGLGTDDETTSIFWQDEILQVMYWMRGEGFGTKIAVSELQKFLDAPDEVMAANLRQLVKNGLVSVDESSRYELSPAGVKEGGRRFADEFDGMLNPGHYECNDPDCDCHSGDFDGECQHIAGTH